MGNKSPTEKSKSQTAGLVVFVLLFTAFTVAVYMLHYKQCISALNNDKAYESDVLSYLLEMQGLDSGYVFPYPLLFRLGAFFANFLSVSAAMATTTTALNSLALIFTYYYVRKYLASEDKGLLYEVGLAGLTVAFFTVSMLFDPRYYGGMIYVGIGTPNTFHNATSVAAKPFSVVTFFSFCELIDRKEERIKPSNAIIFALSLLLCVIAKPSYPLVFLSAAGVYELYRLCRQRFKNFREAAVLLLCVLPTLLFMVYQYVAVFETGGEGIGFGFGTVWRMYRRNIPVAVIKATAFPIVVLAFNFQRIKDTFFYRFAWLSFVFGFSEAFFLYEKGFRMNDFNYSWGYNCALFFLFIASAFVLVRSNDNKVKKGTQWAVFALHLACGILYLAKLMIGKSYL